MAIIKELTDLKPVKPRKEGYHIRPENAWRCPEPDCNVVFDGILAVCPCCGNRSVIRVDGATIKCKEDNGHV